MLTGAWSAVHLPIEWFPSVELPAVTVSASWPGAPPRAVERYVTAPMESTLQGLPGARRLVSVSEPGHSSVRLDVAKGTDLAVFQADVADHLALLAGELPVDVAPAIAGEVPEALREEFGFMTLEVVAPWEPLALRSLAERQVAPRLRAVPGVSSVAVVGGSTEELLVALDAARMDTYGLTGTAVQAALGNAFATRSYGRLRDGARGSLYLFSPAETRPEALARLPLAAGGSETRSVRLRDVATVGLGPAPTEDLHRVDGKPAVLLVVDRAPGSHLLQAAARVRTAVRKLLPDLPREVSIRVADDRSQGVREALRDLARRGGLGLAGVLAVLGLFLRHRSAVALTLVVVSVSVATACLLMRPLGLTVNLLTLAGLALLVGLLVDNAVVLVEETLQRLALADRSPARARDTARAAAEALAEVWAPLLGGTATTVAVLLPVVYLSGDLRTLFVPFCVLAGASLLASLLGAVVLVPALTPWLRTSPTGSRRRPPRRRAARWLELPYAWASRHPRVSATLVALAVGLPTPWLPKTIDEPPGGWPTRAARLRAERYDRTLGSELAREVRRRIEPWIGGVTRPFLETVEVGPRWDFSVEPELRVACTLPAGSEIARTDRLIRPFESLADASPAVRRTVLQGDGASAVLRILIDRATLDTPAPYRLREALISEALRLSGVEVSVSGLLPVGYYSGMGSVSGFPLDGYGASYDRLRDLAAELAARLRRDPRVAKVDLDAGPWGSRPARELLTLRWGPSAQERTSTSASELGERLRPLLLARAPSWYARVADDERMPVRLVVAGAESLELDSLLAHPLRAAGGRLRLGDVATVAVEPQPPMIERQDQQYRRHLLVYYQGPARMGRKLLKHELARFVPPPGYRFEEPTSPFEAAGARREVLWAILGALALVVLVSAAVFESWSLVWVVLASLATAWVGVAATFLIAGAAFNEGAFLGILLTLGVAVNDSLLLCHRYRGLLGRRRWRSRATAARLAVRQRLRPMWTTTCSSVVAMLPLLILPHAGDFWVGLALTVIGGLLASTLLAPALTVAFAGRGRRRTLSAARSVARARPPS